MSGWIKRTNEWARHHPWRSAIATAVILFVVLTILGILVFDRGIGFEAAVAAAYAVTFRSSRARLTPPDASAIAPKWLEPCDLLLSDPER